MTKRRRGTIVPEITSDTGRKFVELKKEGATHTHAVDELVAAAFLGPANGRKVLHKNGDLSDSRPENLKYGPYPADTSN
ncbi:MAG: hypothetical protein C5B54_05735 [Acidobacteria bacterium]|nr:MAG: hypothetical protein C5B54_05735 [Acidobacteriota bacterium]